MARDTVNVVVEDVVPLARHLVDAVYIGRVHGVIFVQGQIIGLSILLACTSVDNLNGRVIVPASFEDR